MAASHAAADPCDSAPSAATTQGVERFEDLYRAHYDAAHRWVRALGVPDAHAEDTVQEIFLVVHRRLGDFDGRAHFAAWLFGITRRVVRTAQRSEQRARDRETQAPAPAGVLHIDDAVQLRRVAEFVDAFLAGLDEPQRLAFLLCDVEGLTAPEAARALEIPTRTVRARLRLARDKFRRASARLRARDRRRLP